MNTRLLSDRQEKILELAGNLDKLNDRDWEDLKLIVFDFPAYRKTSRIGVAFAAINNMAFYDMLNRVLSRRWPEATLKTP